MKSLDCLLFHLGHKRVKKKRNSHTTGGERTGCRGPAARASRRPGPLRPQTGGRRGRGQRCELRRWLRANSEWGRRGRGKRAEGPGAARLKSPGVRLRRTIGHAPGTSSSLLLCPSSRDRRRHLPVSCLTRLPSDPTVDRPSSRTASSPRPRLFPRSL